MRDFSLMELLKSFGRKRVNEDPYPEAAEHPVLHDLDILVLADTHHAIPADQLYQKTQTDPDLVLILGDVNFADLQTFFSGNFVPRETPIYAIFGNHDPKDLFSFFPRIHVLEEGKVEEISVKGKTITTTGLYGSIRYKNTDHYILHSHKESVDLLDHLPKVDLLITHSNPEFEKPEDSQYEDICQDAHCGLYGIGKYIDDKQPALVLHGHLHKQFVRKRKDTYVRCCYMVERFKI